MEEADTLDLPQSDAPAASEFEDVPEDARPVGFKKNFQDAAVTPRSSIDALAEDVAGALEKAAPHEWSLEFSVGFMGKANPVPVLVSGEANETGDRCSFPLHRYWQCPGP